MLKSITEKLTQQEKAFLLKKLVETKLPAWALVTVALALTYLLGFVHGITDGILAAGGVN